MRVATLRLSYVLPLDSVGRAAHGVGDVPVEAREEPKPVLTGKIPSAVYAGVRHGDGAGLAAEHWLALVDADAEPAFGEFVRGAQAGDAAAQDRNRVGHPRYYPRRRHPAPVRRFL